MVSETASSVPSRDIFVLGWRRWKPTSLLGLDARPRTTPQFMSLHAKDEAFGLNPRQCSLSSIISAGQAPACLESIHTAHCTLCRFHCGIIMDQWLPQARIR
jgi:hypothetical protein